jgi:hypothetical protein
MYGAAARDFPSSITVTRAAVLTKDQTVKVLARETEKFVQDPVAWYDEHKSDIKTAVTILLVVTAVAVVLILSAGTAAPVLATEAVIAEEAIAGTAAVSTGVAGTGASSIVVTEGAGVALGLDAGLTQTQLAALRFGLAMRQAQSGVALGSTLAEQAALSDAYLLAQAGSSAAASSPAALNSVMLLGLGGLQGSDDYKTAFAESIQTGMLGRVKDQMLKAGPSVAAVSVQHLLTRGAGPNPSSDAVSLGMGNLYLLKLRSLGALKEKLVLEQPFECAKYTDDLQQQVDIGQAAPPTKLRYLGAVLSG